MLAVLSLSAAACCSVRRDRSSDAVRISSDPVRMSPAAAATPASASSSASTARLHEGGQAVVADHFHQNTGDRENGKSVKQSDATGAAGAIAALPSPDPLGNGVPVPGSEGEATLQNARRDESRRA